MRSFVLLRLPLMAVAAALLCAIGAGSVAVAQQRVGVTSAVNPAVTGRPPGANAAQPVVIGQDVLFNERITTTDKGQTQLLFVDESSMTVGPDSDLTIDQFVYDPKTGTGKLAMNATRGLLRYVGGKLSKQDGAVTLRTSTATLAVRGGAFIVNITGNGQTEVIFIYGNGLTLAGLNGAVQQINRPGFEVTISSAGSMSSPHPASVASLTQLSTRLDGQPGGNGGAQGVSDASTSQGTAQLAQALASSLQSLTTNLQIVPVTSQQSLQLQQGASGAQSIGCGNGSSTGCTAINYSGQVTGTSDPAIGFANLAPPAAPGNANGTVPYSVGTLSFPSGSSQNAVFSGTFGNFGSITFPLPLCSSTSTSGCSATFGPSGTSSTFGTFSGTTYMAADDGFFYATITPTSDPNERLFVFGGTPVISAGAPITSNVLGQTGSTRIFAFTVQPDAALQSNIPFITSQAGGNLPNASVSPFYVVAPPTTPIGDTSTLAGARGLQASLAINGQGANQQSAIEVTTGTFGAELNGQPVGTLGTAAQPNVSDGAQPVFNGTVRGSSLLSSSGTPVAINGSVSSTVDGNGVSLYGSDAGISGFVLSQSPSGAVEVPLSGTSTSYGFAQPAVPTSVPAGVGTSRTTQALTGSFGGLMYTSAQSTPYILTGSALISTDAENNRIQATLGGTAQTPSAGVSSMTLQFGGLTGTPGAQAFVDDSTFAAAESATNPQQVTINGSTTQPSSAQLYLVSSGAAGQPTSILPAGAAYCQCQYLQWGYWGGSLTSSGTSDSDSSTPRIDEGNINFWVAGSPTSLANLQTLETQSATASYTGAAIGSVFNNGANYVAAGGFNGTYNFGSQTGSVAITNFDGHNFALAGSAPLSPGTANYSFGGTAAGFSGTVNGTFYGPNAAETGGNFAFHSVSGPTYLASGIFAGKQ